MPMVYRKPKPPPRLRYATLDQVEAWLRTGHVTPHEYALFCAAWRSLYAPQARLQAYAACPRAPKVGA